MSTSALSEADSLHYCVAVSRPDHRCDQAYEPGRVVPATTAFGHDPLTREKRSADDPHRDSHRGSISIARS